MKHQTDAEALAIYAIAIMELRKALHDLLVEANGMNAELRLIGRARPDDAVDCPLEVARIVLLKTV